MDACFVASLASERNRRGGFRPHDLHMQPWRFCDGTPCQDRAERHKPWRLQVTSAVKRRKRARERVEKNFGARGRSCIGPRAKLVGGRRCPYPFQGLQLSRGQQLKVSWMFSSLSRLLSSSKYHQNNVLARDSFMCCCLSDERRFPNRASIQTSMLPDLLTAFVGHAACGSCMCFRSGMPTSAWWLASVATEVETVLVRPVQGIRHSWRHVRPVQGMRRSWRHVRHLSIVVTAGISPGLNPCERGRKMETYSAESANR